MLIGTVLFTGCTGFENSSISEKIEKYSEENIYKKETLENEQISTTHLSSSIYIESSTQENEYEEDIIESTQKETTTLYVYEESTQGVYSDDGFKKSENQINIECILQKPELPCGCEITSLTMVLNYLNMKADKLYLVENYLPMKPIGEADYYKEFIGDPRDNYAFGCFAPVIEYTANKYFSDIGSDYISCDISGLELEDLFFYIDYKTPVIVWTTMYLLPSYEADVWNVDGKIITWIANEHCVVLTGYNYEKNTVSVADPLKGNVEYDIDLFESRYNELFKQAVVIIN